MIGVAPSRNVDALMPVEELEVAATFRMRSDDDWWVASFPLDVPRELLESLLGHQVRVRWVRQKPRQRYAN